MEQKIELQQLRKEFNDFKTNQDFWVKDINSRLKEMEELMTDMNKIIIDLDDGMDFVFDRTFEIRRNMTKILIFLNKLVQIKR